MRLLDRLKGANKMQEDDAIPYDEDVLNANWTAPPSGTAVGKRSPESQDVIVDPDAFLSRVYRAQE